MSLAKIMLHPEEKIGGTEKNGQVKKVKFTPPILYKYGEIVKICQAGPNQGQGDFY